MHRKRSSHGQRTTAPRAKQCACEVTHRGAADALRRAHELHRAHGRVRRAGGVELLVATDAVVWILKQRGGHELEVGGSILWSSNGYSIQTHPNAISTDEIVIRIR
eukprot:1469240-Pleurochrysis_carterae.AAC.1